jgi:hypothetical protein
MDATAVLLPLSSKRVQVRENRYFYSAILVRKRVGVTGDYANSIMNDSVVAK